MPKPRILYLVTEDWYFLKHRSPLARAARDAGYEVHVATAPGAREAEIRAMGFAYHPLALERRDMNPLTQWRTIGRIKDLYRQVRPDLAHHVALKPILYGGSAARFPGGPAVVNAITGLGFVFLDGGLKRRVLRAFIEAWYRRVLNAPRTRTIFQNPDDMERFVQGGLAPGERTVLIKGSGVDTEAFAPSPEPDGPPIVVLAARMLWDKGVGELVEAARILRAQGLDFEVVLAGVPDAQNPAAIPESVLRGWHAEGVVRWEGYVADMAALLARCHVACLPSYREGLPLALLEAAAAGLPLVATDVPGCREITRHGLNGLTAPPRDPQALAEALGRLLRDADLRRAMGRAGRELVRTEYSQEVVIRATLDLYADLLGEAS